jgi:hypothetical protein
MTEAFEERTLHRFLRTVRIALQTSLAAHDLAASRGASIAGMTSFRALAAKSVSAFRFPEAGVASVDGLLVATVRRAPDGAVSAIVLQAQGSAGLSTYAGRWAELLVDASRLSGRFSRDGTLVLALTDAIEEDRLALLDLSLLDDDR